MAEDQLFGELPEQPKPQTDAAPAGLPRLREPQRDQIELRAVDIDSLIGEDHPARVIWCYVDGLELRDGSGLSRDDRATCRLIDAVIAADGADGPIAKGLARPGQSGTLDDRFLSAPLSERLSAKTGTLNDVTALSGWVRTDSGRPLAFSTVQNPVGRQVQASDLALQAQLLQALLSYPQTPPADQLSPAPPTGT